MWADNIKLDLRRIGLVAVWPRRGTSGGLLWTRYWNFGFEKNLRSSRVAVQLEASQEGLCSIKLVFWKTGSLSGPVFSLRSREKLREFGIDEQFKLIFCLNVWYILFKFRFFKQARGRAWRCLVCSNLPSCF
jgi:hypothetical protein